MAIQFNKLKSPKLGMLDKLTFGKLKDCRVCDVIQDHYEYLIWVEKEGYVQFQDDVIETIQESAHFSKWEGVAEHDSQDDVKDVYESVRPYYFSDMEDDIPF